MRPPQLAAVAAVSFLIPTTVACASGGAGGGVDAIAAIDAAVGLDAPRLADGGSAVDGRGATDARPLTVDAVSSGDAPSAAIDAAQRAPDAATAAADAACPPVLAAEASPLPVQSATARFEDTLTNGFTDEYVYNADDSIKIGVRKEWGGTIVFFGLANGEPGMNNTNVIDANDTGREVQVAFYDPDRHVQNCAWNASCATTATTCPNSIQYLGWNPVQGGNRCNRGSGLDSISRVDGALSVTTTPLHWNPNWDRQDCSTEACNDPTVSRRRSEVEVVQRVRFVAPRIVELDYVITNNSAMSHRATAHELPTVYTGNGNGGPNLQRLFNSSGTEIVIDTPGNDGFFYELFTSPGGWVTMQNDALDYGVGLYHENRLTNWQGWQLKSLPFNNFRSAFVFAIPAHGQIRARSYLLIGSRNTVASDASWLDGSLPPFGSFDGPAAGSTVSGTVPVHGWALDNKGVSSVELVIDGGSPIPLSYGANRPDVSAVWPGYPGGNNVGFTGSFNASAIAAGSCGSVVEIRATDGDGNRRVIARHRVYRG